MSWLHIYVKCRNGGICLMGGGVAFANACKGKLKRLLCAAIAAAVASLFVLVPCRTVAAEPPAGDDGRGLAAELGLDCKGAILMEAQTGTVLYEMNADDALPPASVTKIMTLLLVMEAIERGSIGYDTVLETSTHASSMGGSQIYLKEGEQMTVEDLLKAVVISSANDAAVVLAEAVAGSEAAFVAAMNRRAAELGMRTAHFENTNGLDDTVERHLLSARDIAIMSRELMRHERILKYSSTWMDSVRGGEFGLTNTNRLIRFYRGATGLKTGSTSKAGFCMSATAERDGMSLIAVIMAAPSRDARNSSAAALLDYGFANYAVYEYLGGADDDIRLTGGNVEHIGTVAAGISFVVKKGREADVSVTRELPTTLATPVKAGETVGKLTFTLDGETLGECAITASADADRITLSELWRRLLRAFWC